MWHRDKDFIATEMKQLQKVKMQTVLKEIEQDEADKAEQQFYGDVAFNQWLDKQGLPRNATGPDPNSRKVVDEDTKVKTRPKVDFKDKGAMKDSLMKPNSLRPKMLRPSHMNDANKMTAQTTGSSSWASFSRNTYDSSNMGSVEQSSEPPVTELYEAKPEKPAYYNPDTWTKSTKLPQTEYVELLKDHYPRDVYTMKPKYAPVRGGKPPAEAEKEAGDTMDINTKKVFRVPKLPQEVIDKTLGVDPTKQERAVVYKCKNIIDVQMRKHYEEDALPRQEAGLHLINDPECHLFKAGLQAERIPTTPSTTLSRYSASRSSHSNTSTAKKPTVEVVQVDMPGVLRLMKQMNQPTSYPHITGQECVI